VAVVAARLRVEAELEAAGERRSVDGIVVAAVGRDHCITLVELRGQSAANAAVGAAAPGVEEALVPGARQSQAELDGVGLAVHTADARIDRAGHFAVLGHGPG